VAAPAVVYLPVLKPVSFCLAGKMLFYSLIVSIIAIRLSLIQLFFYMMRQEIILVDELDRAVGTEEKMKVHEYGLLYRAFSVFIVNN
jgi:hypothetical protein